MIQSIYVIPHCRAHNMDGLQPSDEFRQWRGDRAARPASHSGYGGFGGYAGPGGGHEARRSGSQDQDPNYVSSDDDDDDDEDEQVPTNDVGPSRAQQRLIGHAMDRISEPLEPRSRKTVAVPDGVVSGPDYHSAMEEVEAIPRVSYRRRHPEEESVASTKRNDRVSEKSRRLYELECEEAERRQAAALKAAEATFLRNLTANQRAQEYKADAPLRMEQRSRRVARHRDDLKQNSVAAIAERAAAKATADRMAWLHKCYARAPGNKDRLILTAMGRSEVGKGRIPERLSAGDTRALLAYKQEQTSTRDAMIRKSVASPNAPSWMSPAADSAPLPLPSASSARLDASRWIPPAADSAPLPLSFRDASSAPPSRIGIRPSPYIGSHSNRPTPSLPAPSLKKIRAEIGEQVFAQLEEEDRNKRRSRVWQTPAQLSASYEDFLKNTKPRTKSTFTPFARLCLD